MFLWFISLAGHLKNHIKRIPMFIPKLDNQESQKKKRKKKKGRDMGQMVARDFYLSLTS